MFIFVKIIQQRAWARVSGKKVQRNSAAVMSEWISVRK